MQAMEGMIGDVIAIVGRAGDEALRIREKGFTVTTKEHAFDFLTEADTAVERIIMDGLRERFPGDTILAEETAKDVTDCRGRVWIIDPVDGTKYFKDGLDGFAHMVGLTVDGVPTLGVGYAPARDWLVYAQKGEGAFLVTGGATRRLRVSDKARLQDAIAITRFKGGEDRPEDTFWREIGVTEEIPEGSVSLKVARLGLREGDVQLSAPSRWHKWDTCAPQVILEEAGGRMTAWDGRPLDYLQPGTRWKGVVVSSNGKLHDALVKEVMARFPNAGG